MSILIKNATISDPRSPLNGKKTDIFIDKGVIAEIGDHLDKKAGKVIESGNLQVSPGWVDVFADYCDPGYEHKETVATGLDAAAEGGFTDVFVVPNTAPAITSKTTLEYVQQQAKGRGVNLRVLGAVSRNIEGKDLAEMMDMRHAGAIGFSDGWHPVQHAGLMQKALEYVKAFDGIIVQLPVQVSLASGGLMNEGETSVRLGMSGIPNIAESLIVHRDIELVRYTQSAIHFTGVSTPESLALIRAARKDGLRVTCSVTPFHLLYTEERLGTYDSVYKVEPPLRTEAERKLLVEALLDGTIDCIATHHRPQDWDAKVKEFEYAQPGIISQETCLAMLLQAVPQLDAARIALLLSINPRRIFGLPDAVIETGRPAVLSVFDTTAEWTYSKESKKSMGINSPLLGQQLTGRAFNITEAHSK